MELRDPVTMGGEEDIPWGLCEDIGDVKANLLGNWFVPVFVKLGVLRVV